jgi:tetratricopeptide (TPR) repeat protein
MYERASELAQPAKFPENAAGMILGRAAVEAEFGQRQAARADVQRALGMARTKATLAPAASILARAGDKSGARKLSEELHRLYPDDTFLNFIFLPMTRAAMEMDGGNPALAVEHLRASLPYDFGVTLGAGLNTAYLRGLAHLQARDAAKAEAEFQNVLGHRLVYPVSPLLPLTRLGMARAAVLAGDTAKARTAYQDFLAQWKDADPDIPVYQQAKAEYAKIQ